MTMSVFCKVGVGALRGADLESVDLGDLKREIFMADIPKRNMADGVGVAPHRVIIPPPGHTLGHPLRLDPISKHFSPRRMAIS